jgi:hypothetical protein
LSDQAAGKLALASCRGLMEIREEAETPAPTTLPRLHFCFEATHSIRISRPLRPQVSLPGWRHNSSNNNHASARDEPDGGQVCCLGFCSLPVVRSARDQPDGSVRSLEWYDQPHPRSPKLRAELDQLADRFRPKFRGEGSYLVGETNSFSDKRWIGDERLLKKLISQIRVVPSILKHLNRQRETFFIRPPRPPLPKNSE